MAATSSRRHPARSARVALWFALAALFSPSAAAVGHGHGRPVPGTCGDGHCASRHAPPRPTGIRLAESIDYRGAYWIDREIKAPKPGVPRRDRPLTNFINRPDNRPYDDWDRRTFFDRDKRLVPLGDDANRERERQPAIMILKLRF